MSHHEPPLLVQAKPRKPFDIGGLLEAVQACVNADGDIASPPRTNYGKLVAE